MGYMAKRLIEGYLADEGSRLDEHLGRKRIELGGELLTDLFSNDFKNRYLYYASILIKRLASDDQDLKDKIDLIFDSRTISKSMLHAVSTGNWITTNMGSCNTTGISQHLGR
jgi:DNA-directed RNA polymerase beta subunit